VGCDTHGAWMPGYWPQAGPSFITPYPRGIPEWLSKPPLGRTANPWALTGRRSIFNSISLSLLRCREPHLVLGRSRRLKRYFLNHPIRACRGTEGARYAASAATVGVDTGWAPHKPFINCGLHGVSLFHCHSNPNRSILNACPSVFTPSPMERGKCPPVTRLRRGGPFDAACSNRGKGGTFPFPPIAVVSFFLTSAFAQGYVARWLWTALGPRCAFRSVPGIVVRSSDMGPVLESERPRECLEAAQATLRATEEEAETVRARSRVAGKFFHDHRFPPSRLVLSLIPAHFYQSWRRSCRRSARLWTPPLVLCAPGRASRGTPPQHCRARQGRGGARYPPQGGCRPGGGPGLVGPRASPHGWLPEGEGAINHDGLVEDFDETADAVAAEVPAEEVIREAL
jgi:hypothetical protein